MDKIEIMLESYELVLALLDTIEESGKGFPESALYKAIGMSYSASNTASIIRNLIRCNAIQVCGHFILKGKNFDTCHADAKNAATQIRELLRGKRELIK